MEHVHAHRRRRGAALVKIAVSIAIGLVIALILGPVVWPASVGRDGQTSTAQTQTNSDGAGSNGGEHPGATDSNDRSTSIPTLYLHGYHGGHVSTDSMIAYAQEHDDATKVLTATVSSAGEVSLAGDWRSDAKRPLIQVLFDDNTNTDYAATSEWVHNVVTALQQQYHITQYNTVAHSMGNLVAMYYQVQYGQDPSLPKLRRQVNLAGNFDGIIGADDAPNMNQIRADGSPSYQNQHFRYLLTHRAGYPSGVHVLNMYGNLDDGTNCDNNISVASARSLGYILRGETASYREVEVHGAMAQHSKLHENPKVTAQIDDFLWGSTEK